MSIVNAVGIPYAEQIADAGSTSTSSSQQIGKSEFLELLITQLQNQDPMNPMDNQEFIAQMASFSSLEQLISINEAVTKIAGNS
jgi:flagellar basal-body rod modification protein FlgD